MCARVSGVKSGGIYAGHDNHFYGHRKILKPEHLDWQEYALLLLNSMPEKTAEHYRNKIAIYLHWYQKKGIEVPQTQQGDIGAKDIPSWRRICKVLLNNDYWCRALSFSPTKSKNYQLCGKGSAQNTDSGIAATPCSCVSHWQNSTSSRVDTAL